jgi:hypothetical protein
VLDEIPKRASVELFAPSCSRLLLKYRELSFLVWVHFVCICQRKSSLSIVESYGGFQLIIGLLHCLLLPAGYRYKHEDAVLGVRYNIWYE